MIRVLIVEDNPLSALDLEKKLDLCGYRVPWTVSSGEEAIRIVQEQRPDIVLMDIILSGEIDGVEAARIIYERFRIPVLFLTQTVDSAILQRAKRAHAFGYAMKPVEAAELDAGIQIALDKSMAERDLQHNAEQLRSIFDSMTSGFCLVEIMENGQGPERSFFVLEANPPFAMLFGKKPSELQGKRLRDFDTSLSRKCRKAFVSVSCTGGTEKFEFHSEVCNKYFNVFVFVPQVGKIACIVNDITEIRQEEEQLRRNEKRFRELSIRDELTGLYNARHFFDQLNVEIERAVRYGHKISLIFLDIDDFKSYNDSYGHLEGDKVLKRLGRLVQDSIRHSDIAFRYGGEEFAVVLPETCVFEAVHIAERIRKDFGNVMFEISGQGRVQRTLSIGVVEYRDKEGALDFLKRADMNMYKAKSSGKNRTAFDS
ncbi:MAG TPA: diguanylate cyclase [Desulfomicrobiaceae bacterium]|nr:diguanylate cyclase [Desulfomicrobiaceae bacterium]